MNGTLFTFTATLAGGTTSGPLHVQATAYDNASGLNSPKHGDHLIFAISNDLTGTGGGGQTPEPGSLLLLGTGLLGMGGMIRRKLGA
ncbi:MAG TPA: PEP-CTERM sorting domain-containing protein [Candidatus Acidoferrales bacterium]|nr:PEP-CTERM sorting domain-containing protein [Candidatus Acidoferrales bacterium]